MAIPKDVRRQRDFSAGELDEQAVRRDDSAIMRAGARQLSNKRLLAAGPCDQRPGRPLLFTSADKSRVDPARIDGTLFKLCFSAGRFTIRDDGDTILLNETGYPWTADNLDLIVWSQISSQVAIAFPGMRPKMVTHATDGTWSTADFSFLVTAGGQKRVPFWRLTDANITLRPSAITGVVDIVFSADVLLPAHVGTYIRYVERQLRIETVVDAQHGTATVIESLWPSQRLVLSVDPLATFSIGDEVEGETDNAKGLIVAANNTIEGVSIVTPGAGGSGYADNDIVEVNGGTAIVKARLRVTTDGSGAVLTLGIDDPGHYLVAPTNPVTMTAVTGSGTGATADLTMTVFGFTLDVVLTSSTEFNTEDIVGPNGKATISSIVNIDPVPTVDWDDELYNDLRGWPASVSVDQRRLIFADIPAIRGGIGWSAIDEPTDHFPGPNPQDGIFEIVPGKQLVMHVIPGDDEFVMTETGIFYIPISETNPLKPGSVAFRPIQAEPPARVRPIITPQGLVYVTSGLNKLVAVVATYGATKPYQSRDISSLQSHLLVQPKALASGIDSDQMGERYLYVFNGDGSAAVGRYDAGRNAVGFSPWTAGAGGVFEWVGALDTEVLISASYPAGVGRTQHMIERVDATAWLDGQVMVNAAPAALAPGDGQGPLWFVAGATVALMDGLRYLGMRSVDAQGNLVPTEGDDFSSDTLAAGFVWTETMGPFVPHVQEGNSAKQSLRRRKVARIAVTVQNSVGFIFDGKRRVPPYLIGEDHGEQPVPRERTYWFRKIGRTVDPSFTIVKDLPGPLRIVELGYEVTV